MMGNEKNVFNTIVAVSGTAFTYILGGWDKVLIILVLFMAIDYITGLIGATMQQKLSSSVGFKGILRKTTIFLVLIVAVLLDRLLNEGTWVFRTLVCYFYIGNEGISILENAGKCGVPLPEKLVNILAQLKKKGEDEDVKQQKN
jgi:toxin secretion/phage lysis holin